MLDPLTVAHWSYFGINYLQGVGGWGVLPEKLGRSVRPTSQNPYPIYDLTLRSLGEGLLLLALSSLQALKGVEEGKAQMGTGRRCDEKVTFSKKN